jgi:hypothetical protein
MLVFRSVCALGLTFDTASAMNGHSDRLGCQVSERRTGEKGREATYGHLKLMAASVVTGIRQALQVNPNLLALRLLEQASRGYSDSPEKLHSHNDSRYRFVGTCNVLKQPSSGQSYINKAGASLLLRRST